MQNALPTLECPACTAIGLVFDGESAFACLYCGTSLTALPTECPACGTRNQQGADLCTNCHEPLSIVASVLSRHGRPGSPLWIRRLRTQVSALQAAEAEASSRRFEALVDVDRRRLVAQARQHVKTRERERQLMFIGSVALLGLVLLMLVVAAALGGG